MIRIHPEKCSGCTRCEVNCSFAHTGAVSRSRSRVKVVKIEDAGIDYPVICRQCKERYCIRCPESAIEIGELGQVIVSPTMCVSCGICETLCPVGAIELFDDIPHVCDLCGGAPRCVDQCNMGAIEYIPDLKPPVSLKSFKKETKGLTPEDKRVAWARSQTAEMRRQWLATRGE